jgi:hypothetical protein
MPASLLLVAAMLIAEKNYYGELRERLDEPVVATIQSKKKPYDLEVCVANATLSVGWPFVMRDGPKNSIIAASGASSNAFVISVTLIDTPSGTDMELRIRGFGWNDDMKKRLTDCANAPERFPARPARS